jgi:hypothetical protein
MSSAQWRLGDSAMEIEPMRPVASRESCAFLGAGAGLVAPSSGGPVEQARRVMGGPDGHGREQTPNLVAGERNQPVRGRMAGVFVSARSTVHMYTLAVSGLSRRSLLAATGITRCGATSNARR